MYQLFFITLLLFIDQLTRFLYMDSAYYIVNMMRADYKEFFIIYTILLILAIIRLAVVYKRLYGRRPFFDCFFILMIASAISSTIDLIIFNGGRDFILIGNYVANLGDFYCFVSLVFLAIELITNKKGRVPDILKEMIKR